MKRATFALLIGAALAGTIGQAGATGLDPDGAPRFGVERPAARWSREPQVQCAPSRAAEGFAGGLGEGFEAEIDRGLGSSPVVPRSLGERRAEGPSLRMVGRTDR